MDESAAGGGGATLYDVLEVSPRATPMVIRAAYRALARAFHPDMKWESSDPVRMRQINYAYDVLSDPKRRAQYDVELARVRRTTGAHPSARARPSGWRNHRVRNGSEPRTKLPRMSPAGRAIVLAAILAISLLIWLIGGLIIDASSDQPAPGALPRPGPSGLIVSTPSPLFGPWFPRQDLGYPGRQD